MSNREEAVIGIDLGTTFSCVGIFSSDTHSVEIASNRAGNPTTRSWAGFSPDGIVVIGDKASNQKTFIYDAKRMIGKAFS